jgi:hypothetical protein
LTVFKAEQESRESDKEVYQRSQRGMSVTCRQGIALAQKNTKVIVNWGQPFGGKNAGVLREKVSPLRPYLGWIISQWMAYTSYPS